LHPVVPLLLPAAILNQYKKMQTLPGTGALSLNNFSQIYLIFINLPGIS